MGRWRKDVVDDDDDDDEMEEGTFFLVYSRLHIEELIYIGQESK
jgi:hypothetical protein